jgi:hypothetical protein
MTETGFVPGQAQAVDDQPPADDVTGGSRNSARLLIGGAALLAVAVAAGLVFLLGGGDDAAVDDTPAPESVSQAAPPAPEASEAPAAQPGRTGRGVRFRDPFEALIVASSSSSDAGGSTGTAPASDPVVAPPVSSGATQPEVAPAVDTVAAPARSSPHSFRVVSVSPDNRTITVKVDGETYRNLRAGEVFADLFKVRLISADVNSFQYGEEKFNVIGTKRLTIA